MANDDDGPVGDEVYRMMMVSSCGRERGSRYEIGQHRRLFIILEKDVI
jgi:hypothetical protein